MIKAIGSDECQVLYQSPVTRNCQSLGAEGDKQQHQHNNARGGGGAEECKTENYMQLFFYVTREIFKKIKSLIDSIVSMSFL